MSKSIFERECEILQPILLERKSKMTEKQATEFVKRVIETFSFPYASGYALAKIMIFPENESSDKCSKFSFEQIIAKLKNIKKSECPVVFEGYIYAVAKIYGRTVEEIERILASEKYWMAYGSK